MAAVVVATPTSPGRGNGGGGGGLTRGDGIPGVNSCGRRVNGSGGDQTGASGSGELGVGSVGGLLGGGGGGGYYGGGGNEFDRGGGGGSGFGPAGTTFRREFTQATADHGQLHGPDGTMTPADGATYVVGQVVGSTSAAPISPAARGSIVRGSERHPSGTPIDTLTAGPQRSR